MPYAELLVTAGRGASRRSMVTRAIADSETAEVIVGLGLGRKTTSERQRGGRENRESWGLHECLGGGEKRRRNLAAKSMRLPFVIGFARREAEHIDCDALEIPSDELSRRIATIVKVVAARKVAPSSRLDSTTHTAWPTTWTRTMLCPFEAKPMPATSTRLSPTARMPLSSPHFCTC